MLKNFLFYFFLFFSISAYSINFFSKIDNLELSKKITENMSVEEKIGQLFMIGTENEQIDNFIIEEIKSGNLGNIKLFGWNGKKIENCIEIINACQRAATRTNFSIPLFVATDQEGGLVRHIKDKTSISSGNIALGATKNLADTFYTAKYIAKELKVMGINMNFAPDIDVFYDRDADLIGPRTFSSDENLVKNLAIAFFYGQESEKILSTAKHFPGHGRTSIDSHINMPSIYITKNNLLKSDLVPFIALIKEGVPVIMSGHLNFPYITNDNTAASLSSIFLKDILREELDYRGLIITDDLLMTGVQKKDIKPLDIASEAIFQGNDIVIVSRNYDYYNKSKNRAIDRYKNDLKFRDRVDDSVQRVIFYKLKYLKDKESPPLFPVYRKVKDAIQEKTSDKFFQSQATKSVTLNNKNLKHKIGENEKILLAGSYNNFFIAGKKRFKNLDTYFIKYFNDQNSLYSTVKNIENLSKKNKIVMLVSDRETASIADLLLRNGNTVIILSALNPYLSIKFEERTDVVYIFGIGLHSFNAGFAALLNDYIPTGELPVR